MLLLQTLNIVTDYLTAVSVRVEIPLAHPILLKLLYSVGNGQRNTRVGKKKINKRKKITKFVVFPT